MKIWFSPSLVAFYHEGINANVPLDAVEIDPSLHRSLFDAQASGKVIVAGNDGLPVAVDAPAPTSAAQMAALRRERDRRLRETDHTQLPDIPMDDTARAAWAAYRQALRNLPETTMDLAAVAWPEPPAA